MQMCERMMTSQVLADVVVSVGCSCPTLVLLRWDVEMLDLTLAVVVVVDDNTNHAKYDSDVDAASLLDELDDSMIGQTDIPVLFLYDVMEHALP